MKQILITAFGLEEYTKSFACGSPQLKNLIDWLPAMVERATGEKIVIPDTVNANLNSKVLIELPVSDKSLTPIDFTLAFEIEGEGSISLELSRNTFSMENRLKWIQSQDGSTGYGPIMTLPIEEVNFYFIGNKNRQCIMPSGHFTSVKISEWFANAL